MTTRIFYIRDENRNPTGACAWRWNETDLEAHVGDNNDQHVEIAVSFCHPRDQFSRELARRIATGRLNSNKRHSITFQVENPTVNALFERVREFVNAELLPNSR